MISPNWMLICCWEIKDIQAHHKCKEDFLLCVQIKNNLSPSVQEKKQSQLIHKWKECLANQCVLQENKGSTNKQEYKANGYIEDYKNCHVNVWPVKLAVCDDKNVNLPSFTRVQCVLTRTVKKLKVLICGQWSQQWDMWSREPAIQPSFKKKHIPFCSDKSCQSIKYYRKTSPVRPKCGNDKNCQSTMWPKKPINNVQSVTKSSIM